MTDDWKKHSEVIDTGPPITPQMWNTFIRDMLLLGRVECHVGEQSVMLDLSPLTLPDEIHRSMGSKTITGLTQSRKIRVEQTIQTFDKGDGRAFALTFDRHRALQGVMLNVNALKTRGMLEEAFVLAFEAAKSNNRTYSTGKLQHVLEQCDKKRLRAAGKPFPDTEDGNYTLYRGVAGKNPARKIRGLSWTASMSVACWFALRYQEWYHLHDPAVYVATIPTENIYWVSQEDGEQEFVCRPKKCKRLDLDETEMERLAQTYREQKQKAEEELTKPPHLRNNNSEYLQ